MTEIDEGARRSYRQMLARLSPEQRAEWDRCVALFGQKFGADLERERLAREWEHHDCEARGCLNAFSETEA